MKQPQMCPNHACARHGEKRTVFGGCEDCGTQLVKWEDPDRPEPTTEDLARLVANVALFDRGQLLPLERIEDSLRRNPEIRAAWIVRWHEVQDILK
jgi:hypothetical protein